MPDYVTERELNLALDPLKADIWEMKADVKSLVLRAAQAKGAEDQQKNAAAGRIKLSDRKLAYTSIVAALLSPLAWLHLPNPFH